MDDLGVGVVRVFMRKYDISLCAASPIETQAQSALAPIDVLGEQHIAVRS